MPVFSKRTNSLQKDDALKNIVLRMGAESAMKIVDQALQQYGFETYKTKFDYHEIYCAKGHFEYTVSFIEDYGKTYLSILIYSDTKVFSLKKNLKDLSLFLRKELEQYME